MMRTWFENSVAVLFVSLFAGLAIAQRSADMKSLDVPAESKFAIQIDFDAIKKTKLGAMLFDVAKKKAIEELGGDDDESGIRKIEKLLGFDPFEAIQSITLSAADFDHPEESLLAMVSLEKTSGQLEGLALGLPNYESSEYKNHQIHSAEQDGIARVYGAIQGTGEQDRVLVLTPNEDVIKALLDHLDGSSAKGKLGDRLSSDEKKPLLSLEVFEIPLDKIGDGPQANVAKIVDSLALSVFSEGTEGNLSVIANMVTSTEKQAEQLQQMASGLVAMFELAQSMNQEDEEMKKLRGFIRSFETSHEGNNVQLRLALEGNKIVQAIADELDLEIDLAVNTKKSEARKRLLQAQQELEAQLQATKKELENLDP